MGDCFVALGAERRCASGLAMTYHACGRRGEHGTPACHCERSEASSDVGCYETQWLV